MRAMIRTSILWGMLVLLVACSKPLPEHWHSLQPVAASAATTAAPDSAGLQVQFLGAGGIFLQAADQALLGDPFFSNPPLSRWLFGRELPVRTDLIDAHLPPLQAVKGILVGHGHFDHALDIPYVAGKLPDTVKIYGSESIPNLLAAQLPAQRLVDLSPQMASADQPGEWVYLTPQLRVLPILSEHSPHLGAMVLASEHITQPRLTPPYSMFDWQAGTSLSYVIDFLANAGDQAVQFRVFYQSSSSSAPVGFPPQWVLEQGIPFDLAILCAANYDHVEHYPEGILQRLQPRHVMLIHWERFWDDYSTRTATPLPGMDFAELEQRIRTVLDTAVPVWVPMRGGRIQLDH